MEEKNNTWEFVFFKNFQDNSDMHLDFNRGLQVFLLNGSFDDTDFYNFSNQSRYNDIN